MATNPIIHESWREALSAEFAHPYMEELKAFLVEEKKHYTIFPHGSNIFNAFNSTPFESVKVVILGQDPYHGVGQAHGLSFSVQQGIPLPPSLQNIFKELVSDIGCPYPKSGDLSHWAREGVLLLNTLLTVRSGEPFSHKERGWERFTDQVIRTLSAQREHIVFILWGAPAGKKASLIDGRKHLILTAPHPSPLSSYRGFFGSKPFSQTNNYLKSIQIAPIEWSL
ncbi:MAG: uracil-DNA glycosylase [Sulfuricurvum sp.]|uniref:uracil-DNA glycosylase n=1 Tax=Sulfuricurvum sp. TaxID=2025608 RepID=UPI00262BD004|nr:uracil-DNA glycosylase [Sulfuricurvum sp.]MDD2828886.1 uracil-DNA glycosylase [Sulfuricurvum sp.]MDD4948549.1 uracil-DNA glycosylase [Sulfuricurvum sp.]